MSVPHSFAAVTSATGQQLDDNFAACLQLNAANTISNQLNYAPSVSIASSGTVNIGAAASNNIIISGTTTIIAFDTITEGAIRIVTYSGAVPITYNATSMQLAGNASRTNNVGDVSVFKSLGSGNWKEILYQNVNAIQHGQLLGYQIFVANGTYTKATNNPSFVIVEVLGAGGGGGGTSASGSGGGGGGAGGYARLKIAASSLLANETVTIGAGGNGGGNTGTNGSNGGTTSFGAHCSATGGNGGTGNTGGGSVAGGDGGLGSGGDLNMKGSPGGPTMGAPATNENHSGFGGSSIFCGGGAPSAGTSSVGMAAIANSGAGGSGGANTTVGAAQAGGNGGSGICIVYEYA